MLKVLFHKNTLITWLSKPPPTKHYVLEKNETSVEAVEALALTWCQGKHGQGLSGGSHSCDQSPSLGKVLRKDGHSGQEGQTVAHTCTVQKMQVFLNSNLTTPNNKFKE